MTGTMFDEREQAFEKKFAHENETEFLVRTRGGALFVSWIAEMLQLTEQTAATQINRMIDALMAGRSDSEILNVVSAELAQQGQDISTRHLATRLVECRTEARKLLYAH